MADRKRSRGPADPHCLGPVGSRRRGGVDRHVAEHADHRLAGDDLHHRAAPRRRHGRLPGGDRPPLRRRRHAGEQRGRRARGRRCDGSVAEGSPVVLDCAGARRQRTIAETWSISRATSLARAAVIPRQTIGTAHDRVMNRPWTKADSPIAAAWLEEYREQIDLIAAATRRPRFYVPILPKPDPPGSASRPGSALWAYQRLYNPVAGRRHRGLHPRDVPPWPGADGRVMARPLGLPPAGPAGRPDPALGTGADGMPD